jgi:predicted permease
MLSALVLDPLPFREPGRIVEINNSFPGQGSNDFPASVRQYLDFKAHAPALDHLALWRQSSITWGAADRPTRVDYAEATAEIFDVLGVQPLLGRFFTPENHVPANDKVLVLTRSFWRAQFQENPDVLGQTLLLSGDAHEVIGVAPADFESFDARVMFVKPRSWEPGWEAPDSRYLVSARLLGRLGSTATVGTAFSQIQSLERRAYQEGAPAFRDFVDRSEHRIEMDTVQSRRVGPVKTSLFLLQGGVWFVLLIGCVNVANLMLARSNARQGELATRVALGASRSAIARHLMVESLLLTSLGAAIGLGLASSALGVINRFTAVLMPDALPFGLDARVLGYTALVAIGMALLIGVLPIVHVLGGDLVNAMRAQSRGASTGRAARATSGALVVVQMAFALMLLTGAGLLLRSFARATAVDPGFDPSGVVTARIALPSEYFEEDRTQIFVRELTASLREIPGASAGLATATPYLSGISINTFTLRDYVAPEGAPEPAAYRVKASPGFREALRIPLLEGRWFEDADTAEGRTVLVVDERFARHYYPQSSAVGHYISFFGPPDDERDWPEIIGVVGKVRYGGTGYYGVAEDSGNPYVYQALAQSGFNLVSVFLRTQRPTPEVLGMLRERVSAIDAALPVYEAGTMEGVIGASFSDRRGIMLLLVSFAALALLLSAVGIYGVLAYDVSQRVREIGIRGALGASSGQIIRLVLNQGLWKTGAGLLVGLGGALFLSHLMSSLLFEVEPTDPIAYAIVSVLLLVVAVLASCLPALRAANIDPNEALRVE